MALMNRHLAPELETVFMMPAEQYTYISSRLIKEVFMLGGAVDGLVPPLVEERLRAKRGTKRSPMNIAQRMSRVVASPTLRVSAEADRLRRQGIDVVDLGAGEPDFRDTRTREGRGACRARRQLHEVHTVGGHSRASRSGRCALSPRLRCDCQARAGDHHGGRQAGALQQRDGPLRRGRRSHHARPVLAVDRRSGEARRRQSHRRPDAHGGRLRDSRRRDHRGDVAANQGGHRQLAVQSHGRPDLGRRDGGASPMRPPAAASG